MPKLGIGTRFICFFISTYRDKGIAKVPISSEIGVCVQGSTSKVWNSPSAPFLGKLLLLSPTKIKPSSLCPFGQSIMYSSAEPIHLVIDYPVNPHKQTLLQFISCHPQSSDPISVHFTSPPICRSYYSSFHFTPN